MQENSPIENDPDVIRINKKLVLAISIGFISLVALLILLFYVTSRVSILPQIASDSTNEAEEKNNEMLKKLGTVLTEDEAKSLYDELKKMAVKTQLLDISNCEVNPLVLELEGTALTVKNSSDLPHVLSLTQEESYIVEPGTERNITVERESGIYPYGCDGEPVAKGVIYVK